MCQRDGSAVIKILESKKRPALWGSDAFIQSMKEKYYKKRGIVRFPDSVIYHLILTILNIWFEESVRIQISGEKRQGLRKTV
jgi:hypothetical protein